MLSILYAKNSNLVFEVIKVNILNIFLFICIKALCLAYTIVTNNIAFNFQPNFKYVFRAMFLTLFRNILVKFKT